MYSSMESNDIAVRPAKSQVILGDGSIHKCGPQQALPTNSAASRAIVLRSPPPPPARLRSFVLEYF